MTAASTRASLIAAFLLLVAGAALLLWQGEFNGPRAHTHRPTAAPPPEAPVMPVRPTGGEPAVAPAEHPAPLPEEARWLLELPPAYRGEESIRGVVTDGAGNPVTRALVVCTPARFKPFARPQVEALSRRTDARGAFAFDSIPRAPNYKLDAVGLPGHRSLRLAYAQATVAPLTIQLGPVSYERIQFFANDGTPVDVSKHFLGLARHPTLFGSELAPPSLALRSWFEDSGRPLAWDPHEAVYLYFHPAPTGATVHVDAAASARRIHLAGFRSVDVPEALAPLAAWPKPTGRVTLTRGPVEGMRLYRCALPDLPRPTWWGLEGAYPRFSLMVGIGPEKKRQWFMPMRGRAVFWGPSDDRITVRFNQTVEIPFDRHEEEGVVLLAPRLGKLGYLSLRYPEARHDRPGAATLPYLAGEDGTLMDGVLMWPGFARYGPLPVGSYVLTIRWSDTAQPLGDARVVELKGGWQEMDAR